MKTRMKKLISISTIPVLALALLLVLGTVLADDDADEHGPRGIAAIHEVGNNYALAMNTGDLELWLSVHADDIVKMGPDAPSIIGKEQLRAAMEPAFAAFDFEMTINSEETEVTGHWGFDRGLYTVLMTPKAGGEPIFVDGKYLGIYKRQAGGSWKLYIDCYNSNVP